jgi:hypothetical protein
MSSIVPRIAGRAAKIVLGACAFAIVALSTASAQYYQPRGGYYDAPPPGYYRERPQPRYYDDRYERPRRPVRAGHICVTSRGSCQFDRPQRLGGPCKCNLPGFGTKRGEIQY